MGIQPQFASIPRTVTTPISAANTNIDGSGTIVSIFAAGTNGSRVERVRIKAAGTTTAGFVRLFVASGGNKRLYKEIPVTGIVPSGTVASFEAEVPFKGGLILANGYDLQASTHNNETFHIIAEGGDF